MAVFNTVKMQSDLSVSILQALVGIMDDIMQEARKISDMNTAERVASKVKKPALQFIIDYEEASKLLTKIVKESDLSGQTKTRILDAIEEVERQGNHESIGSNYREIKQFIREMGLPKGEEKVLIQALNEAIDAQAPIQTVTLSPACYNKFMQNLRGSNIPADKVQRTAGQNNEYHITYPSYLSEKIDHLIMASKCQVNEIDYMPKEEFYTVVKSMVEDPAAAGILRVNNLSLELSEKILREGRKTSGLILSSEKQPNGTYTVLCYAGDNAEKQKRTQAKLNNLIAKSVFQMTGKIGESEKIRMKMAHEERKKIEDHIYNLEDHPDGGYIFTLRKTKEGYSVPGYIEFNKDQYIYTDRTLDYSRPKGRRCRVQKDQTVDFEKALMSRATGGDGRHFFVSREEFETMKQDLRQTMMLIQDDHDPTASLPAVQARLKELDEELTQHKKNTPLYNQALHEKVLVKNTEAVLKKLNHPNISKDMTPGLFALEIRSAVYTQYLKPRAPKSYIRKEDALEAQLDKQLAQAKEFKIPNTKIPALKPKRGELAKSISAIEAGNVFDSIKVANYGKRLFAKLPEETRNATARKLTASAHEHFQEAKEVLMETRIEMKSLEYSLGLETIDRSWSERKRGEIDKHLDAASLGDASQERGSGKGSRQQEPDFER